MSGELRDVLDAVLAPTFGTEPDQAQLWRTVTELGWHRVGVDEAAGGVGGDLHDVAELAAAVGRHAVALPLVETALAGWALAQAGLHVDALGDGAAVVAIEPADGTLRGLRFLPAAAHVVLVRPGAEPEVTLVNLTDLEVRASANLAGEPVGDASVGAVSRDVMTAPNSIVAALTDRAALLRAAALGGSVQRAARLVGEHVAVREQFGRPLLAQQAVAHAVATIAAERDLISHAVDAALAAPTSASCAAARATAARSSGDAARCAHQLMGAMGITREHPLQHVTRRIWAWRDADGTQRAWELSVGDQVLADRADDALWALATAGC